MTTNYLEEPDRPDPYDPDVTCDDLRDYEEWAPDSLN